VPVLPIENIMKKNIKWLLAEIDQWLNEGLIAVEQAEIIKRRYPAPEQGSA